MKVLVVGPGIPSKHVQMAGQFAFDQAAALSKAGVDVVYLALDLRSVRHWRRWGIFREDRNGMECYVANVPVGGIPVPFLCRIGKKVVKSFYCRACATEKPDIIHAHFVDMGGSVMDIARKHHIPFILTEHSSKMNTAKIDPSVLYMAQSVYQNADAVIAVSTALAENIKRKTGVECRVVPNVVGDKSFFSVQRKPHKGTGFIFTGNLIEHKQPQMLLEAFINIHTRYPDTFLGFIGEGRQKEILKRIVKKRGLGKSVKFYGYQNRKVIAKIYERYDIFVLPSKRETFGVAYIEAMASGMPVIATKCGGPEDFINGRNGILVPPGQEKELEKAMAAMYLSKGSFDSSYIRNNVYEKYCGKEIAKVLIGLYRQIIFGG